LSPVNAPEPAGRLEDPAISHNYHRPDPVSGPDFPAILREGESRYFGFYVIPLITIKSNPIGKSYRTGIFL
jgi:hypothetical protein